MTWWFHLANALYLVSYVVKEILWLRFIACVASTATLLALSRGSAPWQAFAWQLVFFVINLVRLVQLLHARSPVALPPDARRLWRRVFPRLRPRQVARLLAIGEVVDHAAGSRVVARGTALDCVSIIVDGTARVELGDGRRVDLAFGSFIGELCYLTGRAPAADVVAASPLRVVRWPADALRTFLAGEDEVRTAMQLVLGADLATKLRGRDTLGA